MATMKYIGARYMPKFMGTYDPTTAYEALSVVDNGAGTTYVANKPVPAGTSLTDTNYWAVYGASSGAILDLQNRMSLAENDITNLDTDIDTLNTKISIALNVKYPPEGSGLTALNGDNTDETANLQAILNYALQHDMNVFFPEGQYRFTTATVAFTSGHKTLNIFGVGNNSELVVTGAGLVFINTSLSSVPNYCKVENLKFTGTSQDDSHLLSFVNVFNGKVSNCVFYGGYNGLEMISNIWGNVSNCRIDGMKNAGIYLVGNVVDNRALYGGNNALNFIGCVVYNCKYGVYSNGSSGCNFYGCTTEGNSDNGFYILRSGSFNGRGLLISGGWFEFNPNGHIYIDEANGASYVQNMIQACGFVGDSNQTAPAIVVPGTVGSVIIEGCYFKRTSGSWEPYTPNNPRIRSIHNKFNFTTSYDIARMDYNDDVWGSVSAAGVSTYGTDLVTGASKTSTGIYLITLKRWVSAFFCATNNGQYKATMSSINNQIDGTAQVYVVTLDANGNLADTDFYYMGR